MTQVVEPEVADTQSQSSVTAELLRTDPRAWDRFVEGSPTGAYPQLTAWARVKAANGWKAQRIVAAVGDEPVGAQVMTRRLSPSPWSVGYAARGPIAARYDHATIAAFTEAARAATDQHRMTHLTIDPEIEDTEHVRAALTASGWRRTRHVQPERTWVVDLDQPEEALWSGLRSKWRQYVGKARRAGIAVVESDATGLDDFYRIYLETARRAGFLYRTAAAYRDVYEAYAERGAARLLFARSPDGSPVATLMLVTCGRRTVEPYGGMTAPGAETRANYLLKWEAIRRSREAGYAVYDMWGLAHPGIAQFKMGFGGREVRYVGAWELVRNRPLRAALMTAYQLRLRVARRGRRASSAEGGDAT